MPFTEEQRKSLAAKLKRRFVRTKIVEGTQLSYLEGWHAISEANRIFGYDRWDRKTCTPQRIWEQRGSSGRTSVLYSTTVCITVRAGAEVIVREGVGTGIGRASCASAAHEIALKAAETDATKRALATFGNPFGLALYNKTQAGVTSGRRATSASNVPLTRSKECSQSSITYTLKFLDNRRRRASSAEALIASFKEAVESLKNLDDLYALWRLNKPALKRLRIEEPAGAELLERILGIFKGKALCFRSDKSTKLLSSASERVMLPGSGANRAGLAFPKERRVRSKEHLARVRQEPCLLCGRHPTHAHHVRYAQPGALGMKVSDEFTVPLCALHHDALHRVGNERTWWVGHGIDPLKVAEELWNTTGREEQLRASDALKNDSDVLIHVRAGPREN